jgi:hypothetical protein
MAFVASIIASYISQLIDIFVYSWMRKLTSGRWLLLRNAVSSAFSLFIDTCIVLFLMSIFKVLPIKNIWPLIVDSYGFKLMVVIALTPLFYISVAIIRTLIGTRK